MNIKILVVDDSAPDRLIIKNMLKEYEVVTANNGKEAMAIIESQEDIDLIILDLNMPIMNGFEVLEILSSNSKYKNIKTIILTNSDEIENEIKGLNMGALDYIRKPIHMESLKARIDIHSEIIKSRNVLADKVADQEITFDVIFNQAPIGIAISFSAFEGDNIDNEKCQINPMYEEITGRTKEELIILGWANITHPDDLEEDLKNYKAFKEGSIDGYSMDKRLIKPDGSIAWLHLTLAKLGNKKNSRDHIVLIEDITKRKQAENKLKESERSKSVLLSHLPGLAYRCNYDRDWTMQYVSEGCFALTGYEAEALLYNKEITFNDVIKEEYRDKLWEKWVKTIERKEKFSEEYEIVTKTSKEKWVLEMGEAIYNEEGEVIALEGIIFDISNRKEMENKLKYENEHDKWTGLYNRNYMINLLEDELQNEDAKTKVLAAINLSAIQLLTSNYGFYYIQRIVKKIVKTLRSFCNDDIKLFNIYEHRYVYYIKGLSKSEVRQLCEKISDRLEIILMIERISGGIGILEITKEMKDVDQIIKVLMIASEKAMIECCREFGICFYDSEIEKEIMREQEIIDELSKNAYNNVEDGLYLVYQPIFDLEKNKISGFESLARLKTEKLGIVYPLEFIPIAEATKLIISLGKKIIIKSLKFLKKLESMNYQDISISINISVIQLLKRGFVDDMMELIESQSVNPKNITLEITESVFASNNEDINFILNRLKKVGIKISIDDFGTGYSSLSRERDLVVDYLKVDKSFIDRLMKIDVDKEITQDIISMAHKLGHIVIAEGVEFEKQREYLVNYGCDKIQGYLIAKPVSEIEAIKMLE